MYIPYGFFGEIDSTNCITASQEGQETGLFQSGSDVWKYHIWSASGDYEFEITGSNTGSRVVLIGGGGYGGRTVQCNINPGGINADRVAGGGGAGGVYDAPYTLVTRKYNIHVGSGSQHTASNGEDSWVEPLWNPNHPYPYPVYNSPSGGNQNISAEGGGFGGANAQDWGYFEPNKPATQDGGSGGSGGGGAASIMGQSPALPGTLEWYYAAEGSGRTGQGNDGGEPNGPSCETTSEATATGGGGAGASGSNTDCISQAGYLTPAGDGIELNLDGVPRYFAAGGGGVRRGLWENATLGLGSPGCGGSGSTDYFPGGAGNFDDPGTIGGFDLKQGRDGLAAVLVPLCEDQLGDCVQFELEGGVSGGNFTFVACNSGSLTTYSLQPNETTTVCGFGGDIRFYPSGSGTVTYNKTTSSCEIYIEPCPPGTGSEDCESTGSGCLVPTPVNHKIYNIEITGSKSFAPTLAPAVELQYTDCDHNTVVTEVLNSGSIDMFDNIRQWNICADSDYGISASVLDGSPTSSVTVIDSGFVCGEYCELVPLADTPITASGGIVGEFISGSGVGNEFIYKYHIFEPTQNPSFFTRSFQDFIVTDGYTDDASILIIGPGGPGAGAVGTFNTNAFYGAGGGAGEYKLDTLDGFCNAYTLKVSPGWPMSAQSGDEVDVWQEYQGRTIISASNGFYYNSAGVGGRASWPGENSADTQWTERSGSGGGGAAIVGSPTLTLGATSSLQTNGGDGWSGSFAEPTGSAGGGGGAGENGFSGSAGLTARGGEGGDGIQSDITGMLTYYAGGGAGYGPGGPSDGGRGGGADSGIGLATGSRYGAGGGAWLVADEFYSGSTGNPALLNGLGGTGVVITNYKWKENEKPTDFISNRGLAQYYDMYSLDSYNGTGSLGYNLWKNNTTASLENQLGFIYDDDNLGSGSLLIQSSSLRPFVKPQTETTSQLSAMTVWEVNAPIYNPSSSLIPILTDEQFGTSSIGIYAGDLETWGEAVVVKIGDSIVPTESGSAAEFIPRGGFHISQFSYDQFTGEVLWYVDGYSGSAVVNEPISTQDVLLSFNSSSAVTNPDANPVYPAPSQATQYKITKDAIFQDFDFEFKMPQTQQVITRSERSSDGTAWIFASTQVPQITQGTGTIESGSAIDYYPSASLYPGRTSDYEWDRWFENSTTRAIDMFYDVDTCEWVANDSVLTSTCTPCERIIGENSLLSYTWPVHGGTPLDTNVTQSFVEFNDCIFRPPVGLGNNSVYNITAIYTSSLDWTEMKHNDDFLYPRY